MNPQFRQGWSVFAPVPREKARLYYKYYAGDGWSSIVSMEEEMSKMSSPFAERIALKAAFYLGTETRENTVIEKDGTHNYRAVRASYFYKRAGYACLQNLKLSKGIVPDSIEIILERDLFAKPGFTSKKTIIDNYGAEEVR